MSGKHGDCAPGSGCTDCPTCRGEVQPDAPVMKDMEFAMAMAKGPIFRDPILGPLSVVQTVRDGVRRRGNATEGEKDTLVFLEDLLRRSDPSFTWRGFSANPIPDPPSDDPPGPQPQPQAPTPDDPPTDEPLPPGQAPPGSPVEERPRRPDKFRRRAPPHAVGTDPHPRPSALRSPESIFREAKLKLRVIDALREGRIYSYHPAEPPPIGVPPSPGDDNIWSALRCSVLEFQFPEKIHAEIGFRSIHFPFTVHGKYCDILPCQCKCCHFAQLVSTDITKFYGPFPDHTKTDLVEDCYIRDGAGEVVGRTADGDHADASEGEYYDCPHSGGWRQLGRGELATRRMSDTQLGTCDWWIRDEPGVFLPIPALFMAMGHFEFVGVVFDTCKNWQIRAIDSFRIEFVWISAMGRGVGLFADTGPDGTGVAYPLPEK